VHHVAMLRTSPFLLFDGNCAEAMTFYHSCLGGDLALNRLGETPMKEQLSEMPFGIYGQFYDHFGVQWIFRGNAEASGPRPPPN
jgi:uncharacterized glyoxalase superfamily protein PhnB